MTLREKVERWIFKHIFKRYNYLYKSHDITGRWIARSTRYN